MATLSAPSQVQGVRFDTLKSRRLGHVVLAKTCHSAIPHIDLLLADTRRDESRSSIRHQAHHGRSENRPINAIAPARRNSVTERARVGGGGGAVCYTVVCCHCHLVEAIALPPARTRPFRTAGPLCQYLRLLTLSQQRGRRARQRNPHDINIYARRSLEVGMLYTNSGGHIGAAGYTVKN